MDEIQDMDCLCGAPAEHYGVDPYAEAMCDTYGCADPDCSCQEEIPQCDECYTFSVQSI